MQFEFPTKLTIAFLLLLPIFGCRNQTVDNARSDAGLPAAVNSNNADQVNSTARISAPQTVKFVSSDNVEIVGTFYEPPAANSPAVLLLHQWGSNRASYDEFARKLQAKGFGALAIDGRGFGESTKTIDGSPVGTDRGDETVKGMRADVDRAFQFLAKQKNVDAGRIGLVGASYGSSLAMIHAAENKAVKAVALLSPGLNYFGNLPIEDAVENYGARPLLLVAADDDQNSAETVKKLKESVSGEKSEAQIYARGGHGTTLFSAGVGLDDLLEKFLTKNL
jgi:dienelactone hydrolase